MYSISDIISIISLIVNVILVLSISWLYQNSSSKARQKKDYYLSELKSNKEEFTLIIDRILKSRSNEYNEIKYNLSLLSSSLAFLLDECKSEFDLLIIDADYLFITKFLMKLEDHYSELAIPNVSDLDEDILEELIEISFESIVKYNYLFNSINNKSKLLW